MNTSHQPYDSVDHYIKSAPTSVQPTLRTIRKTIRDAVPEAAESISYGMPTYKLRNKPVLYFAAFTKHIGVYATPQAHEEFKSELASYKQGKGSVQFPLNQPIPYDLIARMAVFNQEIITRT